MSNRANTIVRSNQRVNKDDIADLVIDSDPDGGRVVHMRVLTQRMIDRLAHEGKINENQYDAATQLRDNWERARLDCGGLHARELGRPMGGVPHYRAPVGDEDSWEAYAKAINRLSRDERRITIAVVIHDEDPVQWGRKQRCLGIEFIKTSLDKLARCWGL